MKPNVNDASGRRAESMAEWEREQLYRAANRIAIRRFGCSIDSLRDRIVVLQTLDEARGRRPRA